MKKGDTDRWCDRAAGHHGLTGCGSAGTVMAARQHARAFVKVTRTFSHYALCWPFCPVALQCAEHVMLVDLGRNDVGKVSKSGSVVVEKLMEIERYSHVMHISSTVTGQLQPGLDSWDALRAALPAGTVSGAPKVGPGYHFLSCTSSRFGPL